MIESNIISSLYSVLYAKLIALDSLITYIDSQASHLTMLTRSHEEVLSLRQTCIEVEIAKNVRILSPNCVHVARELSREPHSAASMALVLNNEDGCPHVQQGRARISTEVILIPIK